MKCKPNDLAIITGKCHCGYLACKLLATKLGYIVRVKEIVAEQTWLIEEPIPFLVDISFGVPHQVLVVGVSDATLTPLRGDGLTDETETTAPIADVLNLALGITAGAFE